MSQRCEFSHLCFGMFKRQFPSDAQHMTLESFESMCTYLKVTRRATGGKTTCLEYQEQAVQNPHLAPIATGKRKYSRKIGRSVVGLPSIGAAISNAGLSTPLPFSAASSPLVLLERKR